MTDIESLMDELNGRLTAVTVKYPGSKPFIWSFQKHVNYALRNPKEVRFGKLLKKGRNWLEEMKWKHPIFRGDFEPMIKRIDEFESRGE